ncbi:unnamed protein product, partial [Nesidiocoris tenuis]
MTPLTHKDLDALYEKLITGMKTELATFATKAEIGQLVDRVEGLSRENQELRVEIEGLKKQNAGLLSTLDDFDAKIRRNRLIVRGLKPDKDADPRLGTEKFLLDLVGEGNKINVRQAFTLGANGMRSTVLVEMSSDYEADRVLASAGKLRNSGVSISRDLPPGMRKRANRMLRLRWEVKRASPGLSLKLQNDKLRINQHNFSWTDDRLESDGRNEPIEPTYSLFTKNYYNVFGNFSLHSTPAVRASRFGRASGGYLFGVHRKIKERLGVTAQFEEVAGSTVISLNFNTSPPTKRSLVPMYLRPDSWGQDFDQLARVLEPLRDGSVLLMGDANARLGLMQRIPDESLDSTLVYPTRKSKDLKVNAEGKRLLELLEESSLLILNGRTAGDAEGEYTFLGHMGSSVIDYVCVTPCLLEEVVDMVVSPQPYSDHMPTVLSLRLPVEQGPMMENWLIPKIPWTKDDEKKYATRLGELMGNAQTQELEVSDHMQLLTEMIRTAASLGGRPAGAPRQHNPKNPWFDYSCARLWNRLFGMLGLFRRMGGAAAREQYLETRKEYTTYIREKKKDYYASLCRQLGAADNPKDFWSLVNKWRVSTASPCSEVGLAQLKDHFAQLLNVDSVAEIELGPEPWVESDVLDAPFTMAELRAALK